MDFSQSGNLPLQRVESRSNCDRARCHPRWKARRVITSEKRQHVDSRGAPTFEPSTEVGIKGSFKQDVYVVLAGVRGADGAEIRVTFNPLVRWVWLGGALMALGGLVVMWPAADRQRVQAGYAAVLRPRPIAEHVPD